MFKALMIKQNHNLKNQALQIKPKYILLTQITHYFTVFRLYFYSATFVIAKQHNFLAVIVFFCKKYLPEVSCT
jgi:hypothetical protein